MEFKFVKIVVFVPQTHADDVREVLAKSGAGHIGNYDYCSFSVKGTGRFRPLKGSNPYIGKSPGKISKGGEIEEVEEEKIETICPSEKLEAILKAVNEAHPYEEPVIDIYPLLNEGQE